MKVLIIYDSDYGNTKKVAAAVGSGFMDRSLISIRHVNSVNMDMLIEIETLIVGSPTRGKKPSSEILNFLDKIPKNGLQSIAFAAFDTRPRKRGFSIRLFSFLRKKKKNAAMIIDHFLLKKGGIQVMSPEGFFLKNQRGPVYRSELIRAMKWGHEIEVLLP